MSDSLRGLFKPFGGYPQKIVTETMKPGTRYYDAFQGDANKFDNFAKLWHGYLNFDDYVIRK